MEETTDLDVTGMTDAELSEYLQNELLVEVYDKVKLYPKGFDWRSWNVFQNGRSLKMSEFYGTMGMKKDAACARKIERTRKGLMIGGIIGFFAGVLIAGLAPLYGSTSPTTYSDEYGSYSTSDPIGQIVGYTVGSLMMLGSSALIGAAYTKKDPIGPPASRALELARAYDRYLASEILDE